MIINNVSEMYSLIRNIGIENLTVETTALLKCMDEYSRMCSCDTVQALNNKFINCSSYYVNFLANVESYKGVLFSKLSDISISFLNNGRTIKTINR